MAMPFSPSTLPFSKLRPPPTVHPHLPFLTRCECTRSSSDADPRVGNASNLGIGSPIIVVEAPATLKTADAMPCLKVNSGIVKLGDVGRIVARKPKDVWAVRLTVGTFLMDGKYFKPLDLDE
ncbi:protein CHLORORESPIRATORY REDUCTION 42, chloroplastic [Magnolia sinica]|uniref:protein CHLORORESPIRATORY REDUCTION 42, chloroplastic n=1 Tax=Magnolia sinica TaxID=86752 RepID=UPI002659862E|nr:protein CHLORORESPIRATORY REDUCTION 42, chloroplastic [Magnolia sinica]